LVHRGELALRQGVAAQPGIAGDRCARKIGGCLKAVGSARGT